MNEHSSSFSTEFHTYSFGRLIIALQIPHQKQHGSELFVCFIVAIYSQDYLGETANIDLILLIGKGKNNCKKEKNKLPI